MEPPSHDTPRPATTIHDVDSAGPPLHRKRVWTALVLPLACLLTFVIGSSIMVVIASLVVRGSFDPSAIAKPQEMRVVSESRIGLLLLVIPPQLALVAPAIVAALLSPVPTARRLSLVRGHWPLWAWVSAALATPLIGWFSSILVGSLMEQSENLEMMSNIFRQHGETGFLFPLALLIGMTPALCEELVFRGYVGTRLNHAIGPAGGILISSAVFAAFHMDWVHVIAVFPLGLYLGFVAWRSGSLFPAMLAHLFNNSISVFAVVWGPETTEQEVSQTMVLFLFVVLFAGLIAAAITAAAAWKIPMPRQQADTEGKLPQGECPDGNPTLGG
jgi:membrane protease YdiL (CAAX protease family)